MRRRDFLAATVTFSTAVVASTFPGIRSSFAGSSRANRSLKPIILLRSGLDTPAMAALTRTLADIGARRQTELKVAPVTTFDPAGLQHELRQWQGTRLVGVMDTATQVLLEETLRDLGSTILCTGTHRGDPTLTGPSRHHFSSAPAASRIGNAMAAVLTASSHDYCITEIATGISQRSASGFSSISPEQNWAEAVGTVLAMAATDTWCPGMAIRGMASGSLAGKLFFNSLVADI